MSPVRHADRIACPVIVVWAEHDTDEFRRQSQEFAEALGRVGRLERRLLLPEMNHFEGMLSFADPNAPIVPAILEQMRC